MTVRVRSQSEIEAVLSTHPGIRRACDDIAELWVAEAQGLALREAYATGKYVASGRARRRGLTAIVVFPVKWAAPIEGGTGLFGPLHRLIRAKPGKAFVFRTSLPPPSSSSTARAQASALGGVLRTVRITKHRGMPARHIVERSGRTLAASMPGLRYKKRPWVARPPTYR